MTGVLLAADRVHTGDVLLSPGWVEVEGERVTGVGGGAPPRPPDHDLGDATVTPGLVDIHVHGGGGASLGGPPDEVAPRSRAAMKAAM